MNELVAPAKAAIAAYLDFDGVNYGPLRKAMMNLAIAVNNAETCPACSQDEGPCVCTEDCGTLVCMGFWRTEQGEGLSNRGLVPYPDGACFFPWRKGVVCMAVAPVRSLRGDDGLAVSYPVPVTL